MWGYFEAKKKIIRSLIKREILYLFSFFVLGYFMMPFLASRVKLAIYPDTFKALLDFNIEVWVLVLIPYLIFSLIRIKRSLAKSEEGSFLGNLIKKEEKRDTGEQFKAYFSFLILFVFIATISYYFYPKPFYKNFYGEVKDCHCFGHESHFDRNLMLWLWGRKGDDWKVCFGVLYSCHAGDE